MGLSVTTTIFLFIVCLCGGIVIGAMFSRMKKAPPEAQVHQTVEVKETAPAEKSLARAGETEILRAWRDETEKIWLEMDGQRLEAKDDLQTGQKKNLLKLMLDLRPWLETAPAPAPRPQVKETPRPAESAPRSILFAPRPPKAEKKVVMEKEKPKVNLKSIVEQIDDVLQEILTRTVFNDQDIHLLEGPGGVVMVQIGPLKYTGVEAVPNPEIQALIRQAVAEWEKSAR
jgi:hypothetical protein